MNEESCYIFRGFRVNKGRNAKYGEVPYQARIRFAGMDSAEQDHIGGGALITSCWILTAAKRLKNMLEVRNMNAEHLRADLGNRYYQTK